MSTTVIPMAKKLTVIIAFMMFVTFPPVAKLGSTIVIAIIATTRSETIPNEGSCNTRSRNDLAELPAAMFMFMLMMKPSFPQEI
jgi:hypothetical protein